MNSIVRRVIASLLCFVLLISATPLGSLAGFEFPTLSALIVSKARAESPTSGVCGPNLTWSFDTKTTTLTISGTGSMNSFEATFLNSMVLTTAPWKLYYEAMSTLIIEPGVTSIGNYAFYGCTGLRNITIPESIKSLGDHSFCFCSGLTSVNIPNNVTSIGNEAFFSCTGLTDVTLPNSLTCIKYHVFCECTGLTSITIPDSVTTIEAEAFYHCSGLKSISVSNNITSIGTGAFLYCSGLERVDNLNGITSISNRCFMGCSELKSFSIPDSVINIGSEVFRNCTGLISIDIGCNVMTIGKDILSGCPNLSIITVAEENPVFLSEGNCLIKTASNTLFIGCKNCIIPNNGIVTRIGDYAFCDCTGLTSVAIPDSVTSIGNYAFSGCTGLTSVTIPDSVTGIGNYAFSDCAGLSSAIIENGIASISGYTFYDCTGLTSVTIPNSVTSIGDDAFSGCTELKDVYYQGTKVEWEKIIICGGNWFLLHAHIHYLNETFTATFLVDGIVYATETFTATQESIRLPDVPEKPGYTGSWSPYILNEQDITIEAIYKPITYYATFMADGAQVGEAIPFTVLTESITPPAVPEKTGYTGVWQPFTLGTDDLTIVAVYTQNTYYATIIADGAAIAKIPFVYGQKSITLPDVPKKEGHAGVWPTYTLPAHDITIEAVYTPIEYTVTYLVDGQSIGSGPIPYGNPVWQPRIPQKEGYTFDGWTPKVPATMPAEDLTFTAVFKANSYAVTWIVDGAAYQKDSVLFGEPVTAPTPEKAGYTFSGWDAEIPAAMPAKPLTFRGSFTKNLYTLRLIVDGSEYLQAKVEHGEPFQMLIAPSKEGYTFLGWSKSTDTAV
ncbi:MAG: leucine-rich repeat protein, partial [Clostridia bacterium]|nr:leucine-rich repeat protein [Clostridia bacterium]